MNQFNRYQDKKFLVVDDFAEFRTSLTNMLISIGAKDIDTAVNADKAIELYQQKRHDIILCDYNLGENSRDGQQLLEELNYREILRKDCIFIMVTAENSIEMVMGAIEYKPDNYLTKPFTKQSLKSRLDKVYEKKQYLAPILSNLNKQDYLAAVKMADELMQSENRYMANCLQIKGECLLRLGLYQQAAQVYQAVNKQRPLLWALIGYAKAKMGLGQFEQAVRYFEKITQANQYAVNAFDLMAESLLALGETEKAQQALSKAVQISAKSLSRLRQYADLCLAVGQYKSAFQNYRKIMNVGKNSVTSSEEDILKLLNTMVVHTQELTGSQHNKLKTELQNQLKTHQQNFRHNLQFVTALAVIKCIYLQYLQREEDVQKCLNGIAKQLESFVEVRVYLKDEICFLKQLFPDLVNNHPAINEYYQKYSSLSENKTDPLLANELYQQAYQEYLEHKLEPSCEKLIKAYQLSPHNISLALLLMTVLNKLNKQEKAPEDFMQLIENCVKTIKNLDPIDQRFTLFRKNLKQIRNLLASEKSEFQA